MSIGRRDGGKEGASMEGTSVEEVWRLYVSMYFSNRSHQNEFQIPSFWVRGMRIPRPDLSV
jgi:hypothetical protein